MTKTDFGPDRHAHRWPAVALPVVVAFGGVWSLVPVSVWVAGANLGGFKDIWTLWLLGSVITAGITLVVVFLSGRRVHDWLVSLWRNGVGGWPTPRFLFVAALGFVFLALLFTVFISHGNPRYVDSFAQLFQARIFLEGRLWIEPPVLTSHFATLHMIVGPDKWFSQFPPGQPLMLAIGLAVGVWWLLNPVLGLLLVLGTYRVATWAAGETVARVSIVLLCVSPFAVAMAGSAMNHLAAATIGVGAAACATRLTSRRHREAALLSGLLLGVMTAFRPLDAVAAAVPVACITLIDSPRRFVHFALIFAGGVLGTMPTLLFNAQTTGNWLEFGYTYLWGPNHSLGFHDVPFGIPLTPLRAVGITGGDLDLVNRHLFDLPIPLAIVVAAAFIVSRKRLMVRDILPVIGVLALISCLFFYWHRDVYYGPRFLYSIVPWIVIVVARAVQLLWRARTVFDKRLGAGFGMTGLVVAFLFGFVLLTPARMVAYRDSTPSFNRHPNKDAAAAGISNAVVVIADGWGSRLIARMWGRGVSMPASTNLYAAIDACTLHEALNSALPRANVVSQLDSLAALDRPGVAAGFTDDPNLRLPASRELTQSCVDEIEFDRSGFLSFAPYLYLNNATLDGDIVWARDMRDDNAALATHYPGRRFFRYVVQDGEARFVEFDPVS